MGSSFLTAYLLIATSNWYALHRHQTQNPKPIVGSSLLTAALRKLPSLTPLLRPLHALVPATRQSLASPTAHPHVNHRLDKGGVGGCKRRQCVPGREGRTVTPSSHSPSPARFTCINLINSPSLTVINLSRSTAVLLLLQSCVAIFTATALLKLLIVCINAPTSPSTAMQSKHNRSVQLQRTRGIMCLYPLIFLLIDFFLLSILSFLFFL